MRYIVFLYLLGCGAGNGNGHERLANDHQQHPPDTIKTVSSDVNEESEPIELAEGRWWCYDVRSPQPEDGESDCRRTKDICERFRQITAKVKRNPSKRCMPQRTAFCFAAQWPKEERLDRCLRTGEQCETLEKKTRRDPNAKVWPCAEQNNDSPPSGGVY